MYTTQISVDLSGRRRPEIVYAKQGDVQARQVEITFLDNSVQYTIPDGTTARIRVTKPDGTYIFNDCTISDNVVTAPLTSQTLAAAGEATADIALYQGEEQLLSCSVFRLMIEKRAGSDSAAESSDEFGVLDSLIKDAEDAIEDSKEATDAANEAANSANEAASSANSAASAANEAASAANTAADSANSAASAANTAADSANTAASAANSAAQAAEEAAEAAWEAASGEINDRVVVFEEAATRENIESGETASTLFGKIKKWFSDLASGAASTLLGAKLAVSRALVSDADGNVAASEVTSTELGYLDGVTSNVQTQLNAKVATSAVANNLTTTDSGYVLDARQGKTLNDTFASYLPLSGGTLNGSLSIDNNALWMTYGYEVSWSSNGRVWCSGPQHLYFTASSEINYALHLGVHDSTWALDSDVDGYLNLGTSNHRWNTIYATNGSIITSDRNAKNTIQDLDSRYTNLFMRLLPKSFKLNTGTSGRTHVGFISQDVEEAMAEVGLDSLEFGGFCKDQKTEPVEVTKEVEVYDPETGETKTQPITYTEDQPIDGEYVYSLRYEEFTGIITAVLQDLVKRVEVLEEAAKGE